MQAETINLKHYVSVATYLAFRASEIVKECAQNPNLKKYQKAVNDPVTDADFKIQTMICRGLRHFFPNLTIVGQESHEYKGNIELDLSAIGLQNYPHGVELSQKVPLTELVVWIDPIDNTKGFIKGTLDAVTVLIGMSRKDRAQLGVLALPYIFDGHQQIFKPEILMGTVEGKKAFSSVLEGSWNQITRPQPNCPPKFVITDSRSLYKGITDLADKHKAQIYRMGGAGKKIAEVIKGNMDILLYYGANICKWDSCAGEAIILALGGYFTDKYNNPISYNLQEAAKSNYGNYEGSFCGFGKEFYSQIIGDIMVYNTQK